MSEIPGVEPFKGNPNERFEFVKHIGTGGFGDVVLCKDHEHEDKLVIVKLTSFEDPTTRNEILMLSRIHHKYVVQYYDYYTLKVDQDLIDKYELKKFSPNTSAFALVIEFGVGGDFYSYVRKRSSIEEIILVKLISQVGQALEYLNENRTMHRDIKPENFLLDKYNDFKVTDFGTGDTISPEETQRMLTQITGTHIYMAPEIKSCQKYYNYLVDIFSLGMSIYRGCRGDVTDQDLQNVIEDGQVVLPEPIPEQYSPQFYELVHKMIAYNACDRATLPDIKEALLQIVTPKKLSEDEQKLLDTSLNLFYGIDGIVNKKEAISNFEKILKDSELECSEAAFQLAQCYLFGDTVEKNEEQAITLLRMAARKLHVPALKLLAFCYQHGIGVEKDMFTATQLLTIAQKDDAEANFLLGFNLYNGEHIDLKGKHDPKTTIKQDYELAVHYFLKAKDFVLAQNYLGLCYLNGYGVHADINEAYKYFSLAANGGSIDGMYNLANFYLTKYSDNQFYTEKAIKLLTEAAKQYHMGAAFKLSELYSNGTIVPRDEKKASLYSKINSTGPNTYDSTYNLALLKLNGKADEDDAHQVLKNTFEAFYLFSQCSEGHSGALYHLAQCYRDGTGTNKDLKKAADLFEKASNNGIPDATCDLALCLLNGEGRPEDKAKAIKLFTESSELGCSYATYCLAKCYLTCDGVEGDMERSISLLRTAHADGYTEATYLLAELIQSTEVREARELFEIAALKGHAGACYNYGLIFSKGISVYIDKLKSFSFFEKASKHNHPQATTELGKLYEIGFGTLKDENKAFQLYQKAVNLGDSQAQYNLAMCYLNGVGTEIDQEKARGLFEKAAESGNAEAKYQLGLLYQKGIGGPVDTTKAADLFNEASRENIDGASLQLAYCFLNGVGRKTEPNRAFSIFKKLGEKTHYNVEAAFQLAQFYMNGQATRADPEKAYGIFKKLSDEKNYIPAMCELGICCIEGFGTKEDTSKGLAYLKKAAEKRNSKALNLLGVCYLKGKKKSKESKSEGIPEDPKLAIEYFRKAAELGSMLAKVNLATCYIQGSGVPKQPERGYKYLQEAHEDPAAKFRIGVCLFKGAGVPCNKQEGLRLIQEAAETDSNAMCYYGKLLLRDDDKDIPQDLPTARKYIEQSAKLNHPEGMFQYGLILEKEDPEPENPLSMNKLQSQSFFQKSSDAGCSKASFHLGEILFNDKSRQKEAVDYFVKAANLNNIEALERLAEIYNEGCEGVDVDEEKAEDCQARANELQGIGPIDMTSSVFMAVPNKKKQQKKKATKKGKKKPKSNNGFFGLIRRTLRIDE